MQYPSSVLRVESLARPAAVVEHARRKRTYDGDQEQRQQQMFFHSGITFPYSLLNRKVLCLDIPDGYGHFTAVSNDAGVVKKIKINLPGGRISGPGALSAKA